ncbi:MAG: PD-(D/E)XK nuclease family protein, partial [Planctomycetes bacterium]|nr:PD-(D/E)XK nuclease family protein [Planctomycetota bacterium]
RPLFLKAFLDMCAKKKGFPLPVGDIEGAAWFVDQQRTTAFGVLDIVIASPSMRYLLAIENKVYAGEGVDQISRYHAVAGDPEPFLRQAGVALQEGVPFVVEGWVAAPGSMLTNLSVCGHALLPLGFVQIRLEDPQVLVAHDPPEALLALHARRGRPAQNHGHIPPSAHPSGSLSHAGVRRRDDVRRRQAPPQRPRQAQPIDGEGLLQPLPEARRRARVVGLQPPRLGLQPLDPLLPVQPIGRPAHHVDDLIDRGLGLGDEVEHGQEQLPVLGQEFRQLPTVPATDYLIRCLHVVAPFLVQSPPNRTGFGGSEPPLSLSTFNYGWDSLRYPSHVQISDEQMATIRLVRDPFHGDWN